MGDDPPPYETRHADETSLSTIVIKLTGLLVGLLPTVVVGAGEPPDLGGYLTDDPQEPFSAASTTRRLSEMSLFVPARYLPMGRKSPSITDPFKLKYQLIWVTVLPSQSNEGVTPEASSKAFVIWDNVYVLLALGVIPAFASHS